MQHTVFLSRKNVMDEKTRHPLERKTCVILPVMIWMAGLVLAGSEGPLMPYLNIAGAVIFLGASVWLGRILPCLEPDPKVEKRSGKDSRHPAPYRKRLLFCCHDHGCA